MKDKLLRMELLSIPELQAMYRLHLPVVGAVEIRLRCANVRVVHQGLHGLEVVPIIQEGRGEGMPHDVGVNPLLDQCLSCHGLVSPLSL